jgi:hypothetical protein
MSDLNQPDILTQTRPALSATSDMPVIEQPSPSPDNAATQTQDGGEAAAETPVTEGAESEAGAEGEAKPATSTEPPIKKRFADLTRERNEAVQAAQLATQRADKLAAQLDELLPTLKKLAEPPPPKTPEQVLAEQEAADPKPLRSQFDNPDLYDAAIDAWQDRALDRRMDAKLATRAEHERAAKPTETPQPQNQPQSVEQQQQAIIERWNAGAQKATEAHSDWNEVVSAPERSGLISPAVGLLVLDHENGPELLYQLHKHPEDAKRLSTFNPETQGLLLAREFGKFEAKIEAQATTPRVTPPKLPEPIKPVGTRAAATTPDKYSLGNESGENDYYAIREAEIKAQRSRVSTLGPVGTRAN